MENTKETQDSPDAVAAAHPLAGTVIAEKPTTESHNELQARINKDREEAFAQMTPEIRERYELVHKAAAILNEAKIPFYLGALPETDRPSMDYSRFNYAHEPYDNSPEALDTWRKNTWNVAYGFVRQFSLMFTEMRILYTHGPSKTPIGYWESGVYRVFQKKPEQNQTTTKENHENNTENKGL